VDDYQQLCWAGGAGADVVFCHAGGETGDHSGGVCAVQCLYAVDGGDLYGARAGEEPAGRGADCGGEYLSVWVQLWAGAVCVYGRGRVAEPGAEGVYDGAGDGGELYVWVADGVYDAVLY